MIKDRICILDVEILVQCKGMHVCYLHPASADLEPWRDCAAQSCNGFYLFDATGEATLGFLTRRILVLVNKLSNRACTTP